MAATSTRRTDPSYIRNFIFGVEDGLVSTVGLLSGIAIANTPGRTILLAGTVLVFVEAFSMATGSFLSESGTDEYEHMRRASARRPAINAVIMFFSYFAAGLVPLLPYVFLSVQVAFYVSIVAALVALFGLGAVAARLASVRVVKSGFRALIIGGIAVALGVVVGRIFGM